ncbi:hypothetical protein OKA06_00995 [Novosphingobium sp. MW5]|nr:hypothetical protein [Novosphingobium sp. MW5]
MPISDHTRRLGGTMVGGCLVSAILAFYFLLVSKSCGSDCGGEVAVVFTIVGHLAGLCAYIALALLALRGNWSAVLTPAVGFVICCVIFFSFGNLSLILADQETLFYMMRSDYFISESELLRADFQTFAGAATIFAFMRLGFGWRKLQSIDQGKPLSIRAVALLFLILGLALKLLVIVPAEWGYADWTVPGTLMNLQPLADAGFMLLVMAIAQGERNLLVLLLLLWPLHFAICVLSFTKETMIVAILMPMLGAALGGMRFRNILIWSLAVAALFVSTQNSFLAARKDIIAYSGTERHSPIADRITILGRAIVLANSSDEIIIDGAALPPQLWWARLSYAGPQIRASELFDNGQPLPLMYSPFQVLIPRAIWPDKPELTNLGLMFNREVSRNGQTLGRVAFTVFGEGYWMFGWLGVVLFSGLTGLIFGVMTRKSQQWIHKRDLIFLPAILLATKMGAMGVLGFFQTGIAIDFILFLVLAMTLGVVSTFMRQRA